MGSSILKGITTALLVTVLTLFAGIVWVVMHLGGLTISQLLDIGLLASCLIGGYRAAKDSGEWLLGGIVGAGYVTLGTLLLTFFLPVHAWGFIQVLIEGAVIGSLAGAVGAGGSIGSLKGAWSGNRSRVTPNYAGYETNDRDSSQQDWNQPEARNDWRETSSTKGSPRDEESEEVQWSWDMEDVEEPKDWKEATITKAIERSEKEPEVEWPWDKKQEEPRDWKEAPTERIKSVEKNSVIKWPWNREKKELAESEPKCVEPRYVEPKYVEPLRISASASKDKVSGDMPWWEQ
ncbi:MAG TPA: TIGR04086 family membrane protein [Desulfosporosinus sp.]|nr:TIGR04086 family membrane protein [Desulfosporosinus sp.]